MRRLYVTIFSILLSLTAIAQTVSDAFYIYRNDGQFNAFFRDEIDSITYSCYGADNLLYDEFVTQVVYTQDSIYQIPLAAIDSVGFVTPDVVYREGSIPLTGDLFSFLIKSDGWELTFDGSLPTYLMPQIGEKLVSTEITTKLPYCFVGQVKQVSFSSEGIKVLCDSIGLEDAVSQFYGVYDIAVGKNGEYMARSPQRASTSTDYPYDLPFGRIQLPPIDLSAFVTEKDIFGIKSDINYKNTLEVTFTPQIHIKVTRVVDDLRFLSHTNLYVVTNADVETKYDISGEVKKNETEDNAWKKSFLPKQDYLIPPGIPFYFDFGMKASLSGEIATCFTINSHIQQITDITYYDATLIPVIGNIVSPIVNRVGGSINITTMDMTWDYFGADVEFKPCFYIRVGLFAISHVTGWVGGEFDAGLKLNGKLMFDFKRLQSAEPNTIVYEELENMAQIDIKPYVGAHFMAAVLDDNYSFRMGKDFDTPLGTWYQGRILPRFSNTKATLLSDGKAKIEADITNDCFIPYTVGFSLYDNNNNLVETKLNEEKYWTRHAFPSYSCEFVGLEKNKKYKAYPVIRFFGKYDMLASPSVDLDMKIPVEIINFEVTDAQYYQEGFTYKDKKYKYKFECATTVKIDSLENVEDWGYVYEDPDGDLAHISVKDLGGNPYTDTRYAYYRNESRSTVRLYGYVKYYNDADYYYGEVKDYDLIYENESLCPDGNHPHMIDLGLPSGTKWACCNIGASTPTGYGEYYAWGETSSKSDFDWYTYSLCEDGNKYTCADLGDISGSSTYDVARYLWGNPWRMPTASECQELVNNCSSSWTNENGVEGMIFEGPNGNKIFLPAAGTSWKGNITHVGDEGFYWSSTPSDVFDALRIHFSSTSIDPAEPWNRSGGRSVRAVR